MEMFDVRRPDGALTGRVKTREDVHRDGDWHGTAPYLAGTQAWRKAAGAAAEKKPE